jgi:hypothetical protein
MASDMIMPVNIGNPCEFTILQLAELTIKVCECTMCYQTATFIQLLSTVW